MKFGDAVTGGMGKWNLISLGIALLFGTAGLPHILVRFYTVPDAKTARVSVVWAMIIIGTFYILTTFLGFGAATIHAQIPRLHLQATTPSTHSERGLINAFTTCSSLPASLTNR